ncbi:MAG TPA: TraG family conjugative transposon ATPase [Puia sp.]
MEQTLNDLFPIEEISEGCILSKTGEYSVAYELTKPEIFTLSREELEALHQAWVKALRVLPPNSVLHVQDWFAESVFQADFENADTSFLTRASEGFFNERPHLDHRAYLFLTKRPAGSSTDSPSLSGMLKKTLIAEELLKSQGVQEFLGLAGQFERILSDSGQIRFRRLDNDELTGSGEAGRAGIFEQYCQLTAKALPVTRDIAFSREDGVRIGDYQGLLYTLADAEFLPAQCSSQRVYTPYSTDRTAFPIGFATALGPLLNCNHLYNQYIFIEEMAAVRKKMELKQRRMQSLSTHARENSLGSESIQGFLNEALSGGRQLVSAHFNVFAWSEEPADIKNYKKDIPSAISNLGAVPHLETVDAPSIWYAGIPGNAFALPDYERFRTFAEQAACLLMPETHYRSSVSSFGIRLGDRISGYPMQVDISDEPMRTGKITNRNKFVLGGSGSGKSFFTNHLVRSYYEQGAHIVLVDVGGSYKGLCDLLEGYYFTYTEDAPIQFNPFWMADGEKPDTEKKESLKALLLALWKKGDEAFLRSEYVALSNALQGYYEFLSVNTSVFPCFDSFYEYLRDEFVRVLAEDRVKAKDFDMDNFLYVLRPFYEGGEYDHLLNATEQLDLLQQRLIIFELDNIKDHPILFPVVTIIIMEVFISKMRRLKGIRKVILIEEAWKAIAKEGMSEYIKYLFKTVRKFFGEAIVVTQEVEDIISSEVVKQAIINNSDCKILLDQSKFQNRFDEIQSLLGLTEKDKTLVLSVNKNNEPGKKYKEVFISLGNGHSKVYRTEVSLEEYLTYTTEETEKMKVQAYAAQYGSFRNGVARLAEEMRQELNK